VAPGISEGRSQATSAANSCWPTGQRRGAAEQRRGVLWQPVKPHRLELDLPVEAGDSDLREGDVRPEPHCPAERRARRRPGA
jgi:hypothetical protein